MRSNVDTEIGPVHRLCDIWWSLCSSCFSWKMHACHPWNPMPSVWQWRYHTLTEHRSMHVSPWPHDRLWSRIFSCPREHRPEKRPKLPSVLGEYHPGSCWSRRDSANVRGQMEQRQIRAGCPPWVWVRSSDSLLGVVNGRWVCLDVSPTEKGTCVFLNSKRTICVQDAVLFFSVYYLVVGLLLLISAAWHTCRKLCPFCATHSPHQ